MADPQERAEEIVDAVIARLTLPTGTELAALPARLQAIAAEIGDLVVDRAPLRPGEGPRIRVYPWEAVPTLKSASIVSHALLVKLELLREIPEGDDADQGIAPLYVWSIRRLMTPGALEGIATKIEEGRRQYRGAEAERAHAVMFLDVLVTYQTRADDPERRA